MSWKAFSSLVRSKSAPRVFEPMMCEPLEPRQMLSTTVPPGFTATNVGNVGQQGSASYNASTGALTATGGGNTGTDFFSFNDAAYFIYAPITGNGQITVKVDSVSANDPSTPSGLAIRSSLDPNAAESFVALRPDDRIIENTRTSPGANAQNLFVSPATFPEYLRLVRSGNTITSYSSTDGVNFNLLSTTPLSGLGATVYAGMVVSSSSPQETSTAVFENVTVSSLTATLTNAPTVSLPNSSPYQFSVTYASPNDVSAASLGNSNLVVTDPNGDSVAATLVSTGLSNATSLVATYSIPAPTAAGTYTVTEGSSPVTDTVGAVAANPVGTFFAVTPGQAGYSISGKVVSSLNPTIGVANRVVYIDANDSGSFVTGDMTATTDSGGNFAFSGLLPGTYRVAEELPSGSVQTDPILGYDNVTLTPASTTGSATFSELPASLAGSGANIQASIAGQPNAVITGSKAKEKITVQNTGTSTISGPIVVSLMLSPTGTLTAQNTILANVTEPKSFSLKPGKSKVINVSFSYPQVASDAYKLVAVADSTNVITTTNQSDKAAFTNTIQVSEAFRELVVGFAAQPAGSASIGKSGTVTLTVSDIGNATSSAPFTISLYASLTNTLDGSPVLIGKLSKSGVKANQSKSYKLKFAIPKTLAAGSYYFVAGLTSTNNNDVSSSDSTVAIS